LFYSPLLAISFRNFPYLIKPHDASSLTFLYVLLGLYIDGEKKNKKRL